MRPTSRLIRLLGLALAIASAAGGFDRALRAQDPQDAGTWASLGATPQARTDAAAVVLDDGRTLIAGGRTTDGTVTDAVIAFDPSTREATIIGRLLAPRVGHTATLLAGGRVLVTGGTTDGVISSDLEVVDLAAGTSSLVASLIQPRTGHAAAALSDGRVLIVGGTTVDDVALRSAELFDPATSAVSPVVGSMQAARVEASATKLLDGRVLVVGGNDGTQDLSSAEVFEPATESFSALDPGNHLTVPRAGHTALLLPNNNSVLVAGGRSNGAAVASADLFVPPIFPDPYTFGVGKFAATGPMAAARDGAQSAPAGNDGFAFVIGGGPADAEAYRFATIKTDKDDYAPGELATITGSGWQSGEDVTLIFQEDPAVHDDYVLHVTADAQGDIYWNQWAPEQHDLNVRFYLTAVGSRSHAQMTFTDSQPGNVLLTPSSVSVPPGTSAVYPVKVAQNGNSTACSITFSAAYTGVAPIGTTFSFAGPNPVSMTSVDVTTALTITTTNSGGGQTQPGTYPFTVTVTPSGCQGGNSVRSAAGTLVVTSPPAAATTLTLSAATGTFGGAADLSATLTAAGSAVNAKTISFTLNGNVAGTATTNASGVATLNGVSLAGLNAGTYATAVGASFDGDSSFLASSGSGSLTVNKADATVSVVGYTGVYDGNAHGATGSATGVTGEDLSGLLDFGDSFTNVPGGTATWTFAGDGNYNAATGTANIIISKADASITVNGYTGVYDGSAHGATGSATGVKSEDLSSLLSLGDSFTNVPGGTATWTFAGDGNYNTANGTASIVISKADASITVNGYTGVYDGSAHGATGSATGVNGENLSALLSLGDSFTNVPGGTATWSFAGNNNYNTTSGTASIVIVKAEQVITWATPAPVVYGTPLSSTQLNATLTVGDGELTYSPATGAILPVGSQILEVSAAATLNYNAALKQVTLQVTPWHATGFYKPVTMGGSSIVNTIKGGSTVPLKFNLYTSVGGTELTSIDSVAAFLVYPMSCGATTLEDPVDLTTTGGTSLRYDTIERQFIQNWQSPRGAGNCYQVVMTAKDGTALVAFFKTR